MIGKRRLLAGIIVVFVHANFFRTTLFVEYYQDEITINNDNNVKAAQQAWLVVDAMNENGASARQIDGPAAVSNHATTTSTNRAPSSAAVVKTRTVRAAAAMLVGRDWASDRSGRLCYFNKSMDRLQEFWYPTNPYPILLQTDAPWKLQDMQEIRAKWPKLDIEFLDITKQFEKPPLPTAKSMKKQGNNVGNDIPLGYKRMCAYKSYGFMDTPEIASLDYVMMVDDDACLNEPLELDIFQEMRRTNVSYAFSELMGEQWKYRQGLNDFTDQYVMDQNITMANPNLRHALDRNARLVKRKPDRKQIALSPVFSTNLEWIHIHHYKSPEIRNFFQQVQDSKMIFYRRWGDAPLRTVLAWMFWGTNQVMHVCTRYLHSRFVAPLRTHCKGILVRDSVQQMLTACPGLQECYIQI